MFVAASSHTNTKHEIANKKMQEMKIKNEEILKRFEEVEQDKLRYKQEQSQKPKSVHFQIQNNNNNNNNNDKRNSKQYPKRKFDIQQNTQNSNQNSYNKERINYNIASQVEVSPFPEFGWSTTAQQTPNEAYITPQKKFIYNNNNHNNNNNNNNENYDHNNTNKIRNKNSTKYQATISTNSNNLFAKFQPIQQIPVVEPQQQQQHTNNMSAFKLNNYNDNYNQDYNKRVSANNSNYNTNTRFVEQKNSKIQIKIENVQQNQVDNLPPRLRKKKILEQQQQHQQRPKSTYDETTSIFPKFPVQQQQSRNYKSARPYTTIQQQHSLNDYDLSINTTSKDDQYDQFEAYRLTTPLQTPITQTIQPRPQRNNRNRYSIASFTTSALQQHDHLHLPILKEEDTSKKYSHSTSTSSTSSSISFKSTDVPIKQTRTHFWDEFWEYDNCNLLSVDDYQLPIDDHDLKVDTNETEIAQLLPNDTTQSQATDTSSENNTSINSTDTETSKESYTIKATQYETKDFLQWAKLYFNSQMKMRLNTENEVLDWAAEMDRIGEQNRADEDFNADKSENIEKVGEDDEEDEDINSYKLKCDDDEDMANGISEELDDKLKIIQNSE